MLDDMTREAPIFFHGPISAKKMSPFRLTAEIIEQPMFGTRPAFNIIESDPVTARVLQLWRPTQEGTKTAWLREFIKVKPNAPVICWLVCMGAVGTTDALDALLFYGWLGHKLPESARWLRANYDFWGVRRARDIRPHALVALKDVAAGATAVDRTEWLAIEDASALLDACEAREQAEKEEKEKTNGPQA